MKSKIKIATTTGLLMAGFAELYGDGPFKRFVQELDVRLQWSLARQRGFLFLVYKLW